MFLVTNGLTSLYFSLHISAIYLSSGSHQTFTNGVKRKHSTTNETSGRKKKNIFFYIIEERIGEHPPPPPPPPCWSYLYFCFLFCFQRAQVAIGAITITAEREEIVDFSKPFMDFKISLLMQKPTGEELNLFAFLQPFEMNVWLSTIAAVSDWGFYETTTAMATRPSQSGRFI